MRLLYVLLSAVLLLGLLSLTEQRRVCKDHSRHCRQVGNKRPRFRCYRKSTQERCCATCRKFENPHNPECLYGDKLAWCSSIGNRYSAVSCYTHQVECCETCARLASDQIKDCPYGDREIWCPYFTKERCKDEVSRSSCCETCYHLLHGNKATTTTTTAPPATSALRTTIKTNITGPPLLVNADDGTQKVTENQTDTSGLFVNRDTITNSTVDSVTTLRTMEKSESGLSSTTSSDQAKSTAPTVMPDSLSTLSNQRFNLSSKNTVLSSTLMPSIPNHSKSEGKDSNSTLKSVSPTVTYKPRTGSLPASARTMSLAQSLSTSTSSTPSSSSSLPSSSSLSSTSSKSTTSTTLLPWQQEDPATLSPNQVTEIRIKLKETPSPSTNNTGSSEHSAEADGGESARDHSSNYGYPSNYFPNLEDDEDYSFPASGDGEFTIIDDVSDDYEEYGGRPKGHHHNNGGHHKGQGHHNKKGHHKNGAEVPYRYIPAKGREDYGFEDYKSSAMSLSKWWQHISLTLLLPVTWSLIKYGRHYT